MEEQQTCARCGGELNFLGRKSIHEGDVSVGPFKIGLSPLLTPRFEVEVYVCGGCRHLEFFVPAGQQLRR